MSQFTIGVDVGGTNVKLGLLNASGKVLYRSRISTTLFLQNKKKLINAIVQGIEALLGNAKVKKSQVQGVGMGLPGLIDPVKGVVIYLPNIPGWQNVPLKNIMEKELGIPTWIDNDVNVITLAEWQCGAGIGYDNLVCITLGTGVGGGLILNGKMYRGEGFVAGEIGHVPYGASTFEKRIGNKQLLRKARRLLKNKNVKIPDIKYMADDGNLIAKKFWNDVGETIGTVMAGVVNILNPRLIIIGGGVSNNFNYFKDALRQTMKTRAMTVQSRMVKIVRAKLGDDAGLIGGHILTDSKVRF